MQFWMISANGKIYNHAAAFQKWGFIDWKQIANYNIGDIVYIYCTRPYKKVMYKTVVEKNFLSIDETVDDKEFWNDIDEYKKTFLGKYVRLRLIEQSNNDNLSLEKLKLNGLKSAPQGPVKISYKLAQYINEYLTDSYSDGVFPDSDIPPNSFEGGVKKVLVNKYERSSIARQKCIEYHGCNCAVCGMNFKDIYGEIGDNFIHVHHIVPLNTIGEEYRVDYKKDLIPVCPNCHAMLHRKINGKELSVEELKKLVIDRKNR